MWTHLPLSHRVGIVLCVCICRRGKSKLSSTPSTCRWRRRNFNSGHLQTVSCSLARLVHVTVCMCVRGICGVYISHAYNPHAHTHTHTHTHTACRWKDCWSSHHRTSTRASVRYDCMALYMHICEQCRKYFDPLRRRLCSGVQCRGGEGSHRGVFIGSWQGWVWNGISWQLQAPPSGSESAE